MGVQWETGLWARLLLRHTLYDIRGRVAADEACWGELACDLAYVD